MKKKSVIIIGAGPGGLASAMILASQGNKVTVFEKQEQVGGRTSAIHTNGYTFDKGPTFLSMPYLLEELFTLAGRKMDDYLTLTEVDPLYELRFDGLRFSPSRDQAVTKQEIETLFPGNGEGYERFMKDNDIKMERLMPLLQNSFQSIFDYFRWRTIRALPHLTLNQSLYDVLGNYFTDEELKLAFTFQSKYLGMSPWECPGAFSILSYMEHKYGIFHPIGGLNQIPKAFAKVTEEYGGVIHTGVGVKQLLVANKKVLGVLLETGEKVLADDVIVNADFAHAITSFIEETPVKRYTREKINKKDFSCSTFMLYLGLDQTYELPHHTVLFSSDYKKNVEEISTRKVLSEQPSIYVQNAGVTDSTLAPEGKSTLYILAPVPNNTSLLDWESEKLAFRELVLNQVEMKLGISIRDHIEVEQLITPMDWENELNVYQGATFNLSHRLRQMMYFRPHNKFEELENLWLVGGGTHPGSGLPTIFESAKITIAEMKKQERKQRGA
ncbi:phytoene desaturase family protein [Bacillus alkalicellulosilyticus]|uniref:phytoene desaturase family protein n=1 Tax=Alkalihalobacterium alkalicellulosilyticum TaxID=1912214 RepID=UPI0009962E0C|nr:phytoene desaturase family protein [Bacillus alkalicellulosilyticus]